MDIAHDVTGQRTRAELRALGFNDEAIATACRRGEIVRLGPGLYASTEHEPQPPETRHRALALTWARKTAARHQRTDRALAGVSAAAVLGLPVWGLPTDRVVAQDFTRPAGTRTTRWVRLVSDRRPASTIDVEGVALPVVSAAHTVVDVARRHRRIPAIAVGDAAMHAGLCVPGELDRELELARGMDGVGQARAAVAMMNALSESVLESRSRIELADAGVSRPWLQPTICSADGAFIGRVDFYWPLFGLVGEADGEGKYADDPTAYRREKERTDRLHEAGLRMVRWGWRDLDDPQRLARRVRSMMTVPAVPPTARVLSAA